MKTGFIGFDGLEELIAADLKGRAWKAACLLKHKGCLSSVL